MDFFLLLFIYYFPPRPRLSHCHRETERRNKRTLLAQIERNEVSWSGQYGDPGGLTRVPWSKVGGEQRDDCWTHDVAQKSWRRA